MFKWEREGRRPLLGLREGREKTTIRVREVRKDTCVKIGRGKGGHHEWGKEEEINIRVKKRRKKANIRLRKKGG